MNPQEIRMAAARLLETHPFVGVGIDGVSELLGACSMRQLEAGKTLCVEGDPGDELYFLLQGEIRVAKRMKADTGCLVAILDAPALLGHMSLVDGTRRSATCTAWKRCFVAVLNLQVYDRYYHSPCLLGVTLRRMLLSSMSSQLSKGDLLLGKLDHVSRVSTHDVATHLMTITGEERQSSCWNASVYRR